MVLIIRNNVLIYLNLRDTRQIERNKTAAVLCVTLLVFSICRIPHIAINIFELFYLTEEHITEDHQSFCEKEGRQVDILDCVDLREEGSVYRKIFWTRVDLQFQSPDL